MAAIRTKYEQTKVYDPPVKSEVNSVQIFSLWKPLRERDFYSARAPVFKDL